MSLVLSFAINPAIVKIIWPTENITIRDIIQISTPNFVTIRPPKIGMNIFGKLMTVYS